MSALKVDMIGQLEQKKQMELLTWPEKRRKKLLRYVSYRIIRDSRRRVRKRIDLNGHKFSPHPDNWNKKHSIDRVVRYLTVLSRTGQETNIGWKISQSSTLASKIQYGSEEYVMPTRESKEERPKQNNAALTLPQAHALRALGFRKPKKGGKKGQLASIRWMRGATVKSPEGIRLYQKGWHVSQARASVIITTVRDKNFDKSRMDMGLDTEDTVSIPARSFLGATKQEVAIYIDKIFDQMKQELNRGHR